MGQERQYGQLYIIEGNSAVTSRMNVPANSECLQSVMEIIDEVMRANSLYASAYKHMYAMEQREEQDAQMDNRESQSVGYFSSVDLTAVDIMSPHMMKWQLYL